MKIPQVAYFLISPELTMAALVLKFRSKIAQVQQKTKGVTDFMAMESGY